MPTDDENTGSATTLNISVINANTLDELGDPSSEFSFIMVNKLTNKGLLLDYSTLAQIIWDKLISENDMPEDGMKFYFVE